MPLITPTYLSEEQIAEFKGLYKKHYDIHLTDEEAQKKGLRFLQFMAFITENKDAFFDE